MIAAPIPAPPLRSGSVFANAVPAPAGRPSWSGLLQLNLVGIPVKAYPAVRQREAPAFHQLHADCGQRIRCPKHCPVHGPVDNAALVRGYEYGPGHHVVVAADELDQLRPAQDRALRLHRLVPPEECDPVLFGGRSLYLLPDGPAAMPGYEVLQAVMAERGRWALGQLVLSGQRQLVLVRPAAGGLLLHVLHYPEWVRACPRPAGSPPAAAEELRLAGMLLDAVSGEADWSAYRDETAAELRALVEAKLQGQPVATEAPAVVLPFLQALQESLAATGQPVATGPAQAVEAREPASRRRRRGSTPASGPEEVSAAAQPGPVPQPLTERPPAPLALAVASPRAPRPAAPAAEPQVLSALAGPAVVSAPPAAPGAAETPQPAETPASLARPAHRPVLAPTSAATSRVARGSPSPARVAPAPATNSPVTPPRTAKRSALDAAALVLAETGRPMSCHDLIQAMTARGYWTSPAGQTPQATLAASLGKEIATKGVHARFVKVQPGHFALRDATPAAPSA